MAYGVLYTLTWTSLFGESETLEIQDRDLGSDSNTTFILQGNPISIVYDTPNDFVFHSVNGSRAELRLVTQSNFQFRDLYTSDAVKYKVIFKIGSDVMWQGFLMPRYQGKYTAAPYPITFMASDRLGTLKDYDWDRFVYATEAQILGYIFEKTGMELSMQEGLNIYETNHNQTDADSPLDQTYFDGEVFKGKTYYDALYHILFKYLAILRQQNGEWFIHRPRESGYLYNLRKWTISGNVFTYDSVQEHNPIIATTAADVDFNDLVRIGDGAGFHTRPGWMRYALKQDLRLKEAFNENSEFDAWTGSIPRNWFPVVGVMTYTRNGDRLKINSVSGFFFSTNRFYQNNSLGQYMGNQVVNVHLNFDVSIPDTEDMEVRFSFYLPPLGWYDPDAVGYSALFKSVYRKYDNSTNPSGAVLKENVTIDFTLPRSPTTVSSIAIYIHAPTGDSSNSFIEVNEVKLSLMEYVSATENKDYVEEVDFSDSVDVSNSFKPPDMELLLGDPVTYPAHVKHIWDGVLYRDAAKQFPTWNWQADGRSSKLAGLMTATFDDFFQDSQQVVSGPIYTKLLKPCNIIIETNDNNRPYMIKRATWHPKLNRWDVEMFELPFEIDLGSSGTPEVPGKDFILLESESGALLLESDSGGIEKE